MFEENKNLKDSEKDFIKDTSPMPAPYQSSNFGFGSYTKTNKLITALYMVTDIIDKEEPLRNKLRTLGTEIISDINSAPSNLCNKITEIMSFLEIASAVNIISPMNCGILRKEFLELDQSIKEAIGGSGVQKKQINLSEFFREELPSPIQNQTKGHYKSIGQHYSTRIGVQKGSTLMKALSEKTSILSDRNSSGVKFGRPTSDEKQNAFDLLKKQRREDISNFIMKNGGSATITDIKNGAQGTVASCGEKTLQRELISMVKDGVLNKTGEKRWSRYFVQS